MEIDKDIIDKISNLSDKELAEAVTKVGEMLGANPQTAKRISKNPSNLRKRINNISQRDIDKIKKSVGETEIAEIITALGLNNKGGE